MHLIYQPIKRIDQLNLPARKFEALLRINLAGQAIPPGEFINAIRFSDVAQKRLDYWVLMQVLERLKITAFNSYAVNICAPTLDRNLPEFLNKNYGDLQSRLSLEITERGLLSFEARKTIAVLKRSLRVCVDDLGEGYSSLGLVIDLKPNGIKLGRRLVRGLLENPMQRCIVIKLLEFAASQNLRVVAEFVETKDLIDWFGSIWSIIPDLDLWLQGYAINDTEP